MIETVDSLKLANTLNKECGKVEARQQMPPLDILVQVLAINTEGSKFGLSPEESIDVIQHINDACPFLNFRGLMSMGAIGNVEEFQAINKLKSEVLNKFGEKIKEEDFIVSMGTSQDYELAILEGGANQVRLGTTIFGARDYKYSEPKEETK